MKPESRLKSTFQSFIGILLISVVARQSQTTSHLTSDTLSPRGWYLVPKSLVGLKLLVNMRPSLSIFSSSCWVHLCLLTAHCLQCKRWMSQSQRDLALLVCEIFFFFWLFCFCFQFFFLPGQPRPNCKVDYILQILKCSRIYYLILSDTEKQRKARLGAYYLQFVEELTEPHRD